METVPSLVQQEAPLRRVRVEELEGCAIERIQEHASGSDGKAHVVTHGAIVPVDELGAAPASAGVAGQLPT